ncbi:MAG: hypothetical protein MUC87_08235 [Bacteroidia bacterium]|jgi:hypothetical protein|nr:hypothetical protein [Bacteroidia bacterium]
MKLLFTLVNFLVLSVAFAQSDVKLEAYGGTNITRLSEIIRPRYAGNTITELKLHSQLGAQAGAMLSFRNKRLTPVFGLQFSRAVCYGTFGKIDDVQYHSTTLYMVYYMRWDIVRTDILMMAQLALGPEKNIRLTGGIIFSSNLVNLSKQQYLKHSRSSGSSYTFENLSGKVPMNNFNTYLCGGMILPVPETKFSAGFLWRWCPTVVDKMYGFNESGVQVSVVYDLSERLLRKKSGQENPPK